MRGSEFVDVHRSKMGWSGGEPDEGGGVVGCGAAWVIVVDGLGGGAATGAAVSQPAASPVP